MAECNKKTVFAAIGGAIILAGGVIGSSALLSRPSVNLQKTSKFSTEKTIKVKGVAEKNIVSDLGAFYVSISCKSSDIPEGYKELNRISGILRKAFADLDISGEEIQNESISHSAIYKDNTIKENNKTVTSKVFSHYDFTRSCRIVSGNVKKLETASIKLYDLISQNINIEISSVSYFISDPEQYKLELVDAATKSAYQRARTVADTCGSELGPLLVGRQGVIQITRPASNDTSDYGTYDTSSINKVMRLVMTLEFSLK